MLNEPLVTSYKVLFQSFRLAYVYWHDDAILL